MRLLSTTLAFLCATALPPISAASAETEVFVTARLLSLEEQPGCGVFLIGSRATYKVVTGPRELEGRVIEVFVPCAELPRARFSVDSGDLVSFQVGELHYLALSKGNVHKIELPTVVVKPETYFLRAASVHELRSNTSLERTRGR